MERYSDGQAAQIGDVLRIGNTGSGTVVACIGSNCFALPHPAEQWSYLGTGLLVDTDFGGLIHYPSVAEESMALLRRKQ